MESQDGWEWRRKGQSYPGIYFPLSHSILTLSVPLSQAAIHMHVTRPARRIFWAPDLYTINFLNSTTLNPTFPPSLPSLSWIFFFFLAWSQPCGLVLYSTFLVWSPHDLSNIVMYFYPDSASCLRDSNGLAWSWLSLWNLTLIQVSLPTSQHQGLEPSFWNHCRYLKNYKFFKLINKLTLL